ncbi:MAG TPA: hypothetical protein VEG39_21345 [Clostridia bacterium]|nr:hypothetical protein [Clostridia bacterium]
MTDLPEDDLSFTLYEDEKIMLLDKVAGNMRNKFGYFYPLVMAAAALIIAVIAFKFFRRIKRL